MKGRVAACLVLTNLVMLLFLSALPEIGFGVTIPRTDQLVIAGIWGPATVDPAWVYDTASAAVIMNVYSTLINFYVNHSLPDDQKGRTDQFTPDLATEWKLNQQPHSAAPAYVSSSYYFKIREGVSYHDYAYGNVTPADVEYSFERWMAFDRSGGSTWMIYEPLLGVHAADWSNASWPTLIDNSVESNSTHVWFNLALANYPPMIFMQVIAQAWAGVMPQAWAADHGCWPGELYTIANMSAYYDPTVSQLDDYPAGTNGRVECGSGPYKLTLFDGSGHEWGLEWFPDYWRGWPYEKANKYGYQDQCGYDEGWIKTVVFKSIDEWGARKSMFLAGECDLCYVGFLHLPDLITNWDDDPLWDEEEYCSGIHCVPGLPHLRELTLFFNLNITVADNKYIGDPPHDQLHESGIPFWFFNDTHVRKAFAYCFNYTDYIDDYMDGEGIQPSGPMLQGVAYWEYCCDVDEPDVDPPDTVKDPPYSQPKLPNGSGPLPPVPKYYFNLTEAEYYFKLAYGGSGANPGHNPDFVIPGSLWAEGFTFDFLYWTGGSKVWWALYMLEEIIESLNPQFHIGVREVDWPTYLQNTEAKKPVLFYTPQPAIDYPDPHIIFQTWMHSQGSSSRFQSYNNAAVDALIEDGISEIDDNKRIEIYWELANIYFNDCLGLPLVQYVDRHWERDWMEGWYYTPGQSYYFYHYWKGYSADVNFDYQVDLSDLTIIGAAWDSKPGDTDWGACADVDNDGHVFLYDLTMAGTYYG